MPVKPKDDPLADRLLRMRQKLGLTQTAMAKFFYVDRVTLSNWERFGPPIRGPVRALVLIMLKRLAERHRQRSSP